MSSSISLCEAAYLKADECFKDDNYEAALHHYTTAINAEPANAKYRYDRAATYFKLKQYKEALGDLQIILQQDADNSRTLFKKGQCEFYLDNFNVALNSFSRALALGHEQCDLWIRKCKAEKMQIQQQNNASASSSTSSSTNSTPSSSSSTSVSPSSSVGVAAPAAAPAAATLASKVRDQFFQTNNDLTLTILAKNLKQENVKLQLDPDHQHFSVHLVLPDSSLYVRTFHLFGRVSGAPQVSVTPYKVECVFAKEVPDNWYALEVSAAVHVAPDLVKRDNVISAATRITEYPTSSKKLKDWQNVEETAKKMEEEEKPEGEAALQKLFQGIYANADEDTRRAMIKSFQTSGGTVLSTNWKEVKEKNYEKEKEAPKGMEFVKP